MNKIFPVMFKRFKVAQKEAKESKFKEPKIKKTMEMHTHTKEHDIIDKIFFLAHIPQKRKTLYRKMLDLPQSEVEKNIYMLTDILLHGLLEDTLIDKLFYTVLSRLIRSEKAYSIKGICVDYLIAQLSVDKSYRSYAEYLIRNFGEAVSERRDDILEYVLDTELRKRITCLKRPECFRRYSISDSIYYTR